MTLLSGRRRKASIRTLPCGNSSAIQETTPTVSYVPSQSHLLDFQEDYSTYSVQEQTKNSSYDFPCPYVPPMVSDGLFFNWNIMSFVSFEKIDRISFCAMAYNIVVVKPNILRCLLSTPYHISTTISNIAVKRLTEYIIITIVIIIIQN